ncbi:terpenoid cyclases/protein prenyltransferase alpha-alpha toroid [Apiosordaria backusii]|uniref:Protein farnesyltransferase subunit beta n=1 Tax=Apiosordaria backusii TaxID=314023 RepID=A0AA40EN34_9PEZI|nr:terpenoid cyclases/protein prenyltransferase alpha-alpha toroid [Apiosordaria backusii]
MSTTTTTTSNKPSQPPSPPPPQSSQKAEEEENIEIVSDDNDSDFSSIDSEIPFTNPPSHPFPSNPIMIDSLFTTPPPILDPFPTQTSILQSETIDEVLPFLTAQSQQPDLFTYNDFGVPSLRREAHISFLRSSLGRLPGRFVAADASRPWFLYWCLSGLAMLGEDVREYRDAVRETARSMQNPTGGFGGGGGQLSHLATTYAVVLAIALVGGEETYEVIDRRGMWRWLGGLKQRDGGFEVCKGGEEDIRGAYCAAVIITLLDLPLDLTPDSPAYKPDDPSFNLLTGVADYVRRCQTYEGGISGQPSAEAHGAYAFCALGCLALLGHPAKVIPEYLNLPSLLSWLSSRQYAPEGGFSGRTNKLVDGCYSHWVGACFPLIEAALASSSSSSGSSQPAANDSLFSREGLIRYILCCCQDQGKRGGLRDKPSKMSDAYHTCYVLSGLSAGMHQWVLDEDGEGEGEPGWMVLPYLEGEQVFEGRDRVRAVHPVYVIPQGAVRGMKGYFRGKGGF